jgi:phosphohistidine phosphatase
MVLFGKFMLIFIMRHGQAQAMAHSDRSRELTVKGEQEVTHIARWLAQQQLSFNAIFVSPYIRAQQTANIVKNVLVTSTQLTTLDFITPNDPAQKMYDYIDATFFESTEQNILIVSHMPLVSYLVEAFTCGQQAPLFQTASIAEIAYDTSIMKGQLIAHTAPDNL